jgi:hypothetical protein
MWRLANVDSTAKSTVVLLGGSAAREAVAAPETMRETLAQQAGRSIEYESLATSGQTMTETLALATSLRLARGSLLLVQLNLTRLAVERDQAIAELDEPRMPLLDYGEVAQVLRGGRRDYSTRPHLLRARGWLSNLLRSRIRPELKSCRTPRGFARDGEACIGAAFVGPRLTKAPVYQNFVYPDSSLAAAVKAQLTTTYAAQLAAAEPQDYRLGSSLLVRVAELAHQRGWRMAVLVLPSDPRIVPLERTYEARLGIGVDAAERAGASLIDLRDTAAFTSDTFYDLHHLRASGRATATARLARAILPLLREPTPP